MLFFLKTPCFQNFTLLVGGDVFFFLRPVQEGEGEDGDSCCALDVHEFVSFHDGLVEEGQSLRRGPIVREDR